MALCLHAMRFSLSPFSRCVVLCHLAALATMARGHTGNPTHGQWRALGVAPNGDISIEDDAAGGSRDERIMRSQQDKPREYVPAALMGPSPLSADTAADNTHLSGPVRTAVAELLTVGALGGPLPSVVAMLGSNPAEIAAAGASFNKFGNDIGLPLQIASVTSPNEVLSRSEKMMRIHLPASLLQSQKAREIADVAGSLLDSFPYPTTTAQATTAKEDDHSGDGQGVGNELDREEKRLAEDTKRAENGVAKFAGKTEEEAKRLALLSALVCGSVYVWLVCIAICIYLTCIRFKTPPADSEFTYGIFDIFDDTRILICSCCCPAVRWADTVSKEKAGFMSLEVALAVACLLKLVGVISLPMTLLGWPLMTFLGMYYRDRLRQLYGLTSTWHTCFCDCCIWCWFPTCAIIQEAKEVDMLCGDVPRQSLMRDSVKAGEELADQRTHEVFDTFEEPAAETKASLAPPTQRSSVTITAVPRQSNRQAPTPAAQAPDAETPASTSWFGFSEAAPAEEPKADKSGVSEF